MEQGKIVAVDGYVRFEDKDGNWFRVANLTGEKLEPGMWGIGDVTKVIDDEEKYVELVEILS